MLQVGCRSAPEPWFYNVLNHNLIYLLRWRQPGPDAEPTQYAHQHASDHVLPGRLAMGIGKRRQAMDQMQNCLTHPVMLTAFVHDFPHEQNSAMSRESSVSASYIAKHRWLLKYVENTIKREVVEGEYAHATPVVTRTVHAHACTRQHQKCKHCIQAKTLLALCGVTDTDKQLGQK
ncbi:hypothetical protein J1614_005408 [Plenodomus biglobosus]|nr:hypothetical protein J1614_005408 [Plenodomus biglobosus]